MRVRAALAKIREASGQGLVELALVLPVLVGIILGVIDISRAIYAYNSITNLSREGASLASRSGNTYTPQQIMDVLADTAQPLTMQTQGMIYITRAQTDGSRWTFTRDAWQNRSIPPSAITADTAALKELVPGSTGGRSVFICEVFYKYDSLFLPSAIYRAYSPLLHATAVF